MFDIFFPVSAAAKQPETEHVGRFGLPLQYFTPIALKYPLRNLSTNAVVGWMVVEDGKSRRVLELANEQRQYPYAFAVNWDELARLYCLRWKPTMPYLTNRHSLLMPALRAAARTATHNLERGLHAPCARRAEAGG